MLANEWKIDRRLSLLIKKEIIGSADIPMCRPSGAQVKNPLYPALRCAACWAIIIPPFGLDFRSIRSTREPKLLFSHSL